MNSIFNQTYPNTELIVIDDASTDSSWELLESYQDRIDHLIRNNENSGSPFMQWKKGIDLAKGEWIWIAESDDWCEPSFLTKLAAQITEGVGLVYCQTYDMEADKIIVDRLDTTRHFDPNIWERDFELDGKEFVLNYLVEKNYIPNASAVIFKRALVGHNLDDELLDMRMCGDWLFWIRLLSKCRISFLAEHLNYFRYHRSASRIHNTLDRKKQRVLEEELIRRELRIMGAHQDKYLRMMLEKWFDYHKISEVQSNSFRKLNRSGLFPGMPRKFTGYKFRKKLGS